MNHQIMKKRIIEISNEILKYLLEYKDENPDFTFSLRERDSVQSEDKRLEDGHWFQGSYYIYVPLFKKGDTIRKIKTFGFVISFDKKNGNIIDNYIAISFKGGVNSKEEISFHTELARIIKVNLGKHNYGAKNYDNPNDYLKNLKEFLETVRPVALELLEKYHITEKYLVSEKSFEKQLNKINEIKKKLADNTLLKNTPADYTTHGPLNKIIFGPPGTGKTYHSIDIAVKIATGQSSSQHSENKSQFDLLRGEGQIEFVTFHQNYSYEDFMVGLRPDVENDQFRFRSHKGIFYVIAKRARDNYIASKEGTALAKTFEDAFQEKVKPLIEKGQEIRVKMISGVSFIITDINDSSIFFKKPHGDSQHTLSIQTLKDMVEGIRESPKGLSSYYKPLLSEIKEFMKPEKSAKREVLKNYVLIIDEINRANISKVFGELITLLEEDKRMGGENELKISLPNGEKDFCLSPNLFILGTMNTADKSIALVDIALRRRFEFIGMYPEYDKLNKEDSILLSKINCAIYEKKKSADYLIGHAFFMKKYPIESVLKTSIIPLLMEYFSSKTDQVESIFEGTGWSISYDLNSYCWNIIKA